MIDAPSYLVVPRGEAFVLPPAPRPVPFTAWLRASFWVIAGLVFAAMGVLVGLAAIHAWETESLGRVALLALFSAGMTWAGVMFVQSGLRFPGIYRTGKLVRIDELVIRGGGPPFGLCVTDAPPAGAQRVNLEHSMLSGGIFEVTGTLRIAGATHRFRDQLSADDRLAGVLVDGEVSAAALVDPKHPVDRAILVTRRIAGSARAA